MKILIAHNFYQQPGGEDQVFAEEASLLERHGNTVKRFTMDNDAIAGMGKIELARKTIWNSDSQKALAAAIREIKADVVHFHNTFPLISPAAYYTAHENGAAVVQTLHNYRLLCPTATFYRDGGVCEDCLNKTFAWPAIKHACYRGNRSASAAVAAMLTYHRLKGTWQHEVDVFIALTAFAKERFVAGGLPSEKIIVKPNFVDPDPGIGDGKGGFFLFVGRLTDEKGVATLLKAWKPLHQIAGLVLKVAGDGPLREVAMQSAGPGTGIELLGRRPPSEVYDMMGSSTALIFPSQWYEGQPRTIIEAFAKGTPVVGTRLGSMPAMIEDGRTGLLFEPGNSDDLARQVQAMASLEKDRTQMRLAARQEYETHYTASQNYPQLIGCYQRAIDNLSRRPAASSAAG